MTREYGWYFVKWRKTDERWVIANWSEVEGVWHAVGYCHGLPNQVFQVIGPRVKFPLLQGV